MTPEQILDEARAIMSAKAADYTTHSRHENFERAAEVASWFKEDIDKPYVVLIITKIARLASLLGRKQPNNESIEDTFKDLVNYSALWGSKRIEEKGEDKPLPYICNYCLGSFFYEPSYGSKTSDRHFCCIEHVEYFTNAMDRLDVNKLNQGTRDDKPSKT